MRFVWVALGGATGSVLRYAIGISTRQTLFPWTTLFINVSGSFVLGLLLTWALGRVPVSVTTPISVGVLGGFTTFSAFAWEAFFLGRSGRVGLAFLYVLVSVVGGVGAAWFGYKIGQSIR